MEWLLILGAVAVGWILYSKSRGKEAARSFSAFDAIKPWLKEQLADLDTVVFSTYEDSHLMAAAGSIIIVGTAKKITQENLGFLVEMNYAERLITKIFWPHGVATWHNLDSLDALAINQSLLAVMERRERAYQLYYQTKECTDLRMKVSAEFAKRKGRFEDLDKTIQDTILLEASIFERIPRIVEMFYETALTINSLNLPSSEKTKRLIETWRQRGELFRETQRGADNSDDATTQQDQRKKGGSDQLKMSHALETYFEVAVEETNRSFGKTWPFDPDWVDLLGVARDLDKTNENSEKMDRMAQIVMDSFFGNKTVEYCSALLLIEHRVNQRQLEDTMRRSGKGKLWGFPQASEASPDVYVAAKKAKEFCIWQHNAAEAKLFGEEFERNEASKEEERKKTLAFWYGALTLTSGWFQLKDEQADLYLTNFWGMFEGISDEDKIAKRITEMYSAVAEMDKSVQAGIDAAEAFLRHGKQTENQDVLAVLLGYVSKGSTGDARAVNCQLLNNDGCEAGREPRPEGVGKMTREVEREVYERGRERKPVVTDGAAYLAVTSREPAKVVVRRRAALNSAPSARTNSLS